MVRRTDTARGARHDPGSAPAEHGTRGRVGVAPHLPYVRAIVTGMPSSLRAASLSALLAALPLACSAEQAQEEVKEKVEALGSQAEAKGRELADAAGDKAKQWWDDEVPDTGELSSKGKQLLATGAERSGGGVEAALARGQQLAPVALEVGKALREAVQSDTVIEPIVQKVDDPAAQSELDGKIADMPRVETIEGVDVGFKEMTQYDTTGRTTESSYLVLWRRDDRLLGFIYRSKKRIELEALVKDAPRLIALVQGAL